MEREQPCRLHAWAGLRLERVPGSIHGALPAADARSAQTVIVSTTLLYEPLIETSVAAFLGIPTEVVCEIPGKPLQNPAYRSRQ